MTALAQRVRAAFKSPAMPYVGAVAVRAGSRAVWGLALPAVLTVSAYGRYQLLFTVAAMAAQLALLGTPQTIVRYAGQRLPIRALVIHSLVIGAVAIGAAVTLLPSTRSLTTVGVIGMAVLTATVVGTYGARAKAQFAFGTSWRAEWVGAIVLLLATTFIVGSSRATSLTPGLALVVESLALACTAAVFLRARRPRPASETREPAPLRLPALLGDVYSVGALVVLDVVLLRRLEVYFLEHSPDGVAGVAVLGLALQIAAVVLLVPSALLDAWQPKVALIRRAGGDAAFTREVRRRVRQFVPLMGAVTAAGAAIPPVAVTLLLPEYRPWLWYVVAFVGIRVLCAGAGLYSAALYAVGQQRALYAPAAVGGLVALGTNALLTGPLGLRGAVVAYGVTQGAVALLTIAAYYRLAPTERVVASPARVVAG